MANTNQLDMGEKLKDSVYEMANLAHNHLNWARKFSSDIPSEAVPAFLSTV
jgi:hypothetical protein